VEPRAIAKAAQDCSRRLAAAETERKNRALLDMAERLRDGRKAILEANACDLAEAESSGVPAGLVARLRFDGKKIDARIRCLQKIASLPDPVGRSFRRTQLSNGLNVVRVRVPLGVILMIYEARPHVTVNAGAFCLKSGNAAILRGGSEARHCNRLLGELWGASVHSAGLPTDAIQVVGGSHEDVNALLALDELIDLVIPRGGKELIQAVAERSRIPVIKHYAGVCHVYVDRGAEIDRAIQIAVDSKCLMPEVCNAMETLLVSKDMAGHLPAICAALKACGVRILGCERGRAAAEGVAPATERDWETEYLDNVVSIRVVDGVEAACEHINRYGSHHTDAIVTPDATRAQRFVDRVDSAVVLVNASTMFCDGESLGMGAEIGISTDKLHARGPMGLEELTSYKLVIQGDGHVMGPRFGAGEATDERREAETTA
jgi:glutamate-5-semialdehyde dehydrogenase